MPNILKVSPQEVNEKANQINATKENMQALLNDLDSRIKSMIAEDWVSNSGNTYEDVFMGLVNEVNKALNNIQTHANNLSQAANEYAQAETERTSTVVNLDASAIF